MSTPNPLAPQGSLLEQQAKGRSTFHVISFIGAVHVMLLCGILWTACSKDEKPKETTNTLGSTDPYSIPLDNTGGVAPMGNPATNSGSVLPSSTLPATPPGYGTGPGSPAGVGTTPALPPSASPALPSTAPVENATGPAGLAGEYKVVKGDIGESIARKHGVTMKSLSAANPHVNWNRLKVTQVLKIPAPAPASSAATHDPIITASGVVYTVKAGDTGMRIAAKQGAKWADIRRANQLKNDTIHPGQKLTIPTRAAAASPGGEGSPATPPSGSLQPVAIPVPRSPGQ